MVLLTTAQAASFLGLKKNTLEVWRYQKRPPRFYKIGKLVRYSELDLHKFLHDQTRTGTTHQGFQSY